MSLYECPLCGNFHHVLVLSSVYKNQDICKVCRTIEECPVQHEFKSRTHDNYPSKWKDCKITVRGQHCINCGTVNPEEVRCHYNWHVCKSCYPNVCPFVKPEVENAKKGAIIWI
jgi:hypothetical protein